MASFPDAFPKELTILMRLKEEDRASIEARIRTLAADEQIKAVALNWLSQHPAALLSKKMTHIKSLLEEDSETKAQTGLPTRLNFIERTLLSFANFSQNPQAPIPKNLQLALFTLDAPQILEALLDYYDCGILDDELLLQVFSTRNREEQTPLHFSQSRELILPLLANKLDAQMLTDLLLKTTAHSPPFFFGAENFRFTIQCLKEKLDSTQLMSLLSVVVNGDTPLHDPETLQVALKLLRDKLNDEEWETLLYMPNQKGVAPTEFLESYFFHNIEVEDEKVFLELLPLFGKHTLNNGATLALTLHQPLYLQALVQAGGKTSLKKNWQDFLLTLSVLSCQAPQEEVERFAYEMLHLQVSSKHFDFYRERVESDLQKLFSYPVPKIPYKVRLDPSSSINWSDAYGGEHTQKRYEKRFRESMAGALFFMSKSAEFNTVLEFLGERRKRMAILENQLEEGFGVRRSPENSDEYLVTPITNRYMPYYEKIKQKIKEGEPLKGFTESFIDSQGGVQAQIAATIDGEEIFLTKIEDSIQGTVWLHTPYAESETVLQHVNELYQEVLANRLPPKESLEYLEAARIVARKIIEIHWWMAHAVPFERGSAAITEMLVRSLFLYHGIETTPWQVGAIADCEALIEGDLDSFCALYPTLMEEGYSQALLSIG